MKKIALLLALAVFGFIGFQHDEVLQVLHNFSAETEVQQPSAAKEQKPRSANSESLHNRSNGTGVQQPPAASAKSELDKTLDLIRRGGPFPYSRDGIVFENREKLLPIKPQGYYREYTVTTPGLNHRGARRVVTGGNPPEVYYYTEDHYRSFRKISP